MGDTDDDDDEMLGYLAVVWGDRVL